MPGGSRSLLRSRGQVGDYLCLRGGGVGSARNHNPAIPPALANLHIEHVECAADGQSTTASRTRRVSCLCELPSGYTVDASS